MNKVYVVTNTSDWGNGEDIVSVSKVFRSLENAEKFIQKNPIKHFIYNIEEHLLED
jgi:hypothetical protein